MLCPLHIFIRANGRRVGSQVTLNVVSNTGYCHASADQDRACLWSEVAKVFCRSIIQRLGIPYRFHRTKTGKFSQRIVCSQNQRISVDIGRCGVIRSGTEIYRGNGATEDHAVGYVVAALSIAQSVSHTANKGAVRRTTGNDGDVAAAAAAAAAIRKGAVRRTTGNDGAVAAAAAAAIRKGAVRCTLGNDVAAAAAAAAAIRKGAVRCTTGNDDAVVVAAAAAIHKGAVRRTTENDVAAAAIRKGAVRRTTVNDVVVAAAVVAAAAIRERAVRRITGNDVAVAAAATIQDQAIIHCMV